MKYEKRADKYIFTKDGAYFALTLKQVNEISMLSTKIVLDSQKGNKLWYKIKFLWKVLTIPN